VFRQQWGRTLASLIGLLGDFALAEEAVADAFAIAAERWPRDGIPERPGAWLIVTARNRAIDRIRRERTLQRKLPELAGPGVTEEAPGTPPEMTIPDERLELLFTCCHPALALDAQVALTLRALGGLGTEEIARAFLVSPETMKRRLTRAKTKIKTAGIPFAVPGDELLSDRLAAVLAVIYLIFNQGYSSVPERSELVTEAIRLGQLLAELMPDEAEALGLLSLMMLHDARRDARLGEHGEPILLADQDQQRWDHRQISTGRTLLDRAIAIAGPTAGTYVLQAAIASLQCEPAIDWVEVSALYARLALLTRSPVVECNRAVAVAHAAGDAAGLAIVDRLLADGALTGYPYLHATRGELLQRLSRAHEARTEYERALAMATNAAQRAHLERRLRELSADQ
jgi:RNA polymerase sigma-70 factor (ECF subfamily)